LGRRPRRPGRQYKFRRSPGKRDGGKRGQLHDEQQRAGGGRRRQRRADKLYANSPYLFTAAATDSGDARATYSNFGAYVDIAAPGSGIYTTNSSGGYSSVSGTSFSSPNTAAVIALVMSANPTLTPTDVTSIITNTAKDLGSAGWDAYYGFGRVDALAATQMAAGVRTSDTTPPTVAVANRALARRCRASWQWMSRQGTTLGSLMSTFW